MISVALDTGGLLRVEMLGSEGKITFLKIQNGVKEAVPVCRAAPE
jgi:hypothetical protein